MNKQIPSYLKLVTDTNPQPPGCVDEDLAAIAAVCHAFEQATGWRLVVDGARRPQETTNLMWSAPVDPGVGNSPGHIRLFSSGADITDPPPVGLDQATLLADAVGKLWSELLTTRHALWQREAELAAGVPLVLHDEQSPPLGEQLEGVLQAGAEAVDCHAAALYLLDSATTQLKLRASWGLPRKRLADPARELRGSLADLEALLGHAVVLNDETVHDHWKVPEKNFSACVCVPVSSPTMPLGTLWIFSRTPRDFTDPQTNIIEVVAGRLAADLERQVLVDEALLARDRAKEIAASAETHPAQVSRIAPMVDGWEIAANAYHAGSIGGTFYDWFAREDGSLAIVAGDARQRGLAGALCASSLRATCRAIGAECQPAGALLEKANSVLWTGSAGHESAGLFQGILAPHDAACEFASAGPMRIVTVRPFGGQSQPASCEPLGLQEELYVPSKHVELATNDLLLVYGTTFLGDADELVLEALDERLSLSLEPRLDLPTSSLTEIANQILAENALIPTADRVLLMAKRKP